MYIFDDNDIFHRNPCTAVEIPGSLTLQIKVKRFAAKNPCVYLCLDGGSAAAHPMIYDHAAGNYDVYKLVLYFDTPGLFWYYFEVESDGGTRFRVPEYVESSYQITVCKPDKHWPDWIQGGVIYHIFVDRFAHDGKIRIRPGAIHRADWGGCPYFLPDEKGIVKNNDFFGGNLYGIIEKLPYLEQLGVTCIYLSPIFEADSNHKYDTGDYMKVDEAFGGDEALEALIKSAGKCGIKIILDGVFNHVGSNSKYFNRYGRYVSVGAYQDRHKSPYRDWFTFREDGKYDAWWGIELLPSIRAESDSYREFLCGKDGVIAHWMKLGVAGWRLDVVDELSDVILDPLCEAMRREADDVFIAGEVWEDASYKIAYSKRRRYFLGGQLHSVTNYPLRDAIICCVKDGNISKLVSVMTDLKRNYPKKVLNSLMNIVGTHDTARILTALSDVTFPEGKLAMSHFRLSPDELAKAKKRLKIAAALQFTLPGVPCVYYGDEAGMEGCIDPFNRICYPWGNEDKELIAWYIKLSKIRKENPCFKDGEYTLVEARDGLYSFTRGEGKNRVLVAVNISGSDRTVTPGGRLTQLSVSDGRMLDIPGSADAGTQFTYDLINEKEIIATAPPGKAVKSKAGKSKIEISERNSAQIQSAIPSTITIKSNEVGIYRC